MPSDASNLYKNIEMPKADEFHDDALLKLFIGGRFLSRHPSIFIFAVGPLFIFILPISLMVQRLAAKFYRRRAPFHTHAVNSRTRDAFQREVAERCWLAKHASSRLPQYNCQSFSLYFTDDVS